MDAALPLDKSLQEQAQQQQQQRQQQQELVRACCQACSRRSFHPDSLEESVHWASLCRWVEACIIIINVSSSTAASAAAAAAAATVPCPYPPPLFNPPSQDVSPDRSSNEPVLIQPPIY
jgi:hypothetical protein